MFAAAVYHRRAAHACRHDRSIPNVYRFGCLTTSATFHFTRREIDVIVLPLRPRSELEPVTRFGLARLRPPARVVSAFSIRAAIPGNEEARITVKQSDLKAVNKRFEEGDTGEDDAQISVDDRREGSIESGEC